ncbi:guanine nucleotide-binding protein subunit gamma 3 [Fagus crenata]
MAAQSGSSSSVPSLPPPRPKSPPQYPDLYGKRRETAKVQMLEREIGFLEKLLAVETDWYDLEIGRSVGHVASGNGSEAELVNSLLVPSVKTSIYNYEFSFCAVECPVLTSLGSAVAAKCHAAAVIAIHATIVIAIHATIVAVIHATLVAVIHATGFPVWVVIFQSGGVALVPVQIAVKMSHAEEIVAEIVAVSLLFHAPIALAAHAHAHAHVLNVQRIFADVHSFSSDIKQFRCMTMEKA